MKATELISFLQNEVSKHGDYELKDVRTWEDFQPSWEHKIFKPFDRVLRKAFEGNNSYRWYVDIYNYWNEEEKVHCMLSGHWNKDEDILPFKGNEELAGKEVE